MRGFPGTLKEHIQEETIMGTVRSELGFQRDRKDHKQEQMEPSKHMQFPFLNGPFAIPWQIHEGYSESAKLLLPRHREAAFLASYAKSNYCYCRYLGLHVGRDFRLKNRAIWHLVLKKTKRNLYTGDDRQNVVRLYAQFLTYLGDLHIQIVRCLENGINLRSTVKDLRACDVDGLTDWLDTRDVPQTNELNPYLVLQVPGIAVGPIHKVWMRQNDPQIERLHDELDCGI